MERRDGGGASEPYSNRHVVEAVLPGRPDAVNVEVAGPHVRQLPQLASHNMMGREHSHRAGGLVNVPQAEGCKRVCCVDVSGSYHVGAGRGSTYEG